MIRWFFEGCIVTEAETEKENELTASKVVLV